MLELGRKEAVEHRPIVAERHLWVALWTDPDRHFAAAKAVRADLDIRFVAVEQAEQLAFGMHYRLVGWAATAHFVCFRPHVVVVDLH